MTWNYISKPGKINRTSKECVCVFNRSTNSLILRRVFFLSTKIWKAFQHQMNLVSILMNIDECQPECGQVLTKNSSLSIVNWIDRHSPQYLAAKKRAWFLCEAWKIFLMRMDINCTPFTPNEKTWTNSVNRIYLLAHIPFSV